MPRFDSVDKYKETLGMICGQVKLLRALKNLSTIRAHAIHSLWYA